MSFFESLFGGGMEDAQGSYQNYMQKSMDELRQHEQQGRGDISQYYGKAIGFGQPYREAGTQALGAYQASLGLQGQQAQQGAVDKFQASPGYQYALHQGLQGAQRGMAARGLGGSGAEMQALQRTGQGIAGQDYGQYQQRLANLAGAGQQAAGQAGQFAMGAGGQLGQMGEYYGGRLSSAYQNMGQEQMMAELAQQQRQGSMFGSLAKGAGWLAGGGVL